MPPFGDDSDVDSEDAYDLQDVSSDVEFDADGLDDADRLVTPLLCVGTRT